MATVDFKLSSNGAIPLFWISFWCLSLLLSHCPSAIYGQTEITDPKPALDNAKQSLSTLVNNATKSMQDVAKTLFQTMAQRLATSVDAVQTRLKQNKQKMANATVALLERMGKRIDVQSDRSGNETTKDVWQSVRAVIDALKNMIQKTASLELANNNRILFSETDDGTVIRSPTPPLTSAIPSVSDSLADVTNSTENILFDLKRKIEELQKTNKESTNDII